MNRLSRPLSLATFASICAVLLLLPRTGSTHEPITTKVMFNKEVIRILHRNCLGCHSPAGIKPDISLTTYEEARPWAKAIKEEVLEKRMMPYQAVKGYGSFQHDYTMPQRDQELLISWIEGGAPKGDEKDYPKQAIEQLIKGESWPLGRPDLILQPEKETSIEAGGDDETRCFPLPTGLDQDRWVRGFDFQPGTGPVVYGASFLIARAAPARGRTGSKAAGSKKDACGAQNAGLENIGHWVPGQAPQLMPDGIGQLLPARSRVLVKIHYRKNGEPATGRSRLGLYFARDEVSRIARYVKINARRATPATNSDGKRVKASYTITDSADALAIRPLLYPRAKSVEATAHRPDGSVEVLIWARNYRFDWQPAYFFKRPVPLPKGTRIEVVTYLDDPAENVSSNTLCEITLTGKK